jgi:hypothetical protein
MMLIQKHEKDEREDCGQLMGVEDTNRWPVDSLAFRFLLRTSSAGSIAELNQHAFISQRPSKGELSGLARFAMVAAQTSYFHPCMSN